MNSENAEILEKSISSLKTEEDILLFLRKTKTLYFEPTAKEYLLYFSKIILNYPHLITKRIRYTFVSLCPESISLLDQDEDLVIFAIGQGATLDLIKKQSSRICLKAVMRSSINLKFVKKQTNQICFEAIKNSPSSIKYITNQTPDLCLIALDLVDILPALKGGDSVLASARTRFLLR